MLGRCQGDTTYTNSSVHAQPQCCHPQLCAPLAWFWALRLLSCGRFLLTFIFLPILSARYFLSTYWSMLVKPWGPVLQRPPWGWVSPTPTLLKSPRGLVTTGLLGPRILQLGGEAQAFAFLTFADTTDFKITFLKLLCKFQVHNVIIRLLGGTGHFHLSDSNGV